MKGFYVVKQSSTPNLKRLCYIIYFLTFIRVVKILKYPQLKIVNISA